MVVPPDDGPRYAQNMYTLRKYTKNKLGNKLVFVYTIISRYTVNKTLKKPLVILAIKLYLSFAQEPDSQPAS